MRFTILSIAAILSLSVSAFSQTPILTCNATSVPPIVRGEGIAERIGDIVVGCSGGAPNAQMTGNLSVFFVG